MFLRFLISFFRSIAMVEDLYLDKDDYDDGSALLDEMERAYQMSSNNCYVAALLYTVTLVVSGFQFWLNNRAPPTTGYQRYGWRSRTRQRERERKSTSALPDSLGEKSLDIFYISKKSFFVKNLKQIRLSTSFLWATLLFFYHYFARKKGVVWAMKHIVWGKVIYLKMELFIRTFLQ